MIQVLANFGLVTMDTGFFVKTFSVAPKAVVPGYMVGGIAYFAIPWALGTTVSFVARGLEHIPRFPTSPRRMSATETSNGLILPYAGSPLAGKGGATDVLLITFSKFTVSGYATLQRHEAPTQRQELATNRPPSGLSKRREIWLVRPGQN